MILIENIEIYGWEAAVRGARNPMNSWSKLDSHYNSDGKFILGDNDIDLLKRLSNAGNDHGKFMRMIGVTMDVTAPLYYWKEADQYKVGTTTNSCSTMHKIHSKRFEIEDFSTEHLTPLSVQTLKEVLRIMNIEREDFLKTKNKERWWQMIQLLPSSYNQTRTWCLNYAVLKNIYHARKDHKLDEWKDFCKMIEKLPYSELIIDGGNGNK